MHKRVTLSLPEGLLAKIDSERGDVSRSAFVRRILSATYRPPPTVYEKPQTAPPRAPDEDAVQRGIVRTQAFLEGKPQRPAVSPRRPRPKGIA